MAAHSDTIGIVDKDLPFDIDIVTGRITKHCDKNTLIQYSHNSERFSFEMDRYIEGHDMMNCNKIVVEYLSDTVPGEYEVDDLTVTKDDENKVTFSWLISSNATQNVGTLYFAVVFECTDNDGNITYRWPSDINQDFTIKQTIANDTGIVYEHEDILEQWKQQLFYGSNSVVANIQAEGRRQQTLIVNKGVEVRKTIPDDYTTLGDRVANLYTALGVDIVTYTFSWTSSRILSLTNGTSYNPGTNYNIVMFPCHSNFVAIGENIDHLEIHRSTSDTGQVGGAFYSGASEGYFISSFDEKESNNIPIPDGAKYFRINSTTDGGANTALIVNGCPTIQIGISPELKAQVQNNTERITTLESDVNSLKLNGATGGSPYKGKTSVCFGDSIMAGWGWQEGTGIIQPLKEKYTDGTWLNKAESGANMAITSNPAHTPIVTQIRSYTGVANAIIFDGGVNDVNNGISIGSITSGYDDTYDTSTFCGAMESSLQYIMDNYPLAVKLFIIPHSFAKDNSYVDGIYEKAIEICNKWNMPLKDMRKCAQIAMTASNKAKYTYNPNTGEGDTVHGNELFYRTFYSPIIDQTLQMLGIGYSTVAETPETIPVTGVSLNKTTLTLTKDDQFTLVATIEPTNATDKSVTWSADNANITVSNGIVTAKTKGTSVVTVKTTDGGYTAKCTVTINEKTTEPDTGYTELTSLALDGNCYFDTEILPDQSTNTEAKLYIKSGTTYICGARDDNYKYGYTKTDNFYAIRGTVSSAAKNSAYWEDEWIIKQNGVNVMFNSNTVTLDATDSFSLTSPFFIGNMSKNNEPAGDGLIGKVYYAKIYSGAELIADIVPAKKTDGTLCLYDKIRKKYIYKSGSGILSES